MILLSAETAYGVTKSKKETSAKKTLTTKLITDAKTAANEQPSFLVQHADTIKKISDVVDFSALISFILYKIIFKITQKNVTNKPLLCLFTSPTCIKLFLDPLTKYSIDKKHNFKLKQIQKTLNFDVQKKALTNQQSFFIRNTDKFKKISYVTDFLPLPLLLLSIYFSDIDPQTKLPKPHPQQNPLAQKIHTASFYTFITKMFLHPTVKYLMNKKNTFELEDLQTQIDALEKKETKTA